MAYQVTAQHQNQTYTFSATADETVLEAADRAGIPLPSSCRAGVCTTCAARVLTGTLDQDEALGVAPELKDQGYVLLCVAYAQSDLQIEAGKEDEVYALQFGTGS